MWFSHVSIDAEHGYIFMLQNWWADMEYLEVSALYLARSNADIHFVEEPLTRIPDDLPIMNARATEADDNGGDMSMPEY